MPLIPGVYVYTHCSRTIKTLSTTARRHSAESLWWENDKIQKEEKTERERKRKRKRKGKSGGNCRSRWSQTHMGVTPDNDLAPTCLFREEHAATNRLMHCYNHCCCQFCSYTCSSSWSCAAIVVSVAAVGVISSASTDVIKITTAAVSYCCCHCSPVSILLTLTRRIVSG